MRPRTGRLRLPENSTTPRLKIHGFDKNVRHVRNFERALGLATGDLIFLSDQDDIWLRGKREKVASIFAAHPETTMAVHALSLIDAEGNLIRDRSEAWPRTAAGEQSTVPYLVRQLVKNQVTGCAVAFRRELLDILLPFPDAVYAHDHWLSVAAPFAGKVRFVDEILLNYRQHDANVTPKAGSRWRSRSPFAPNLGGWSPSRPGGRLAAAFTPQPERFDLHPCIVPADPEASDLFERLQGLFA